MNTLILSVAWSVLGLVAGANVGLALRSPTW